MEKYEKFGYAIFLLLMLIIVTPKISNKFIGNVTTVAGLSLNDFTLISILTISLFGLFWIFFGLKPTFTTANVRFRRLYHPKSDLNRIRQYIKEETDKGVSKQKINHSLNRVGWNQELIDNAFSTADKAKVIVLKPTKKRKHVKKK
jgi:hypothetical protein